MTRPKISLLCLLMTPSLFLAGCSSNSGGGGVGTLALQATDAPIPHSDVTEATIWVWKITVRNGADDTGFHTLFDSDADPDVDPIEMNLLELRNGIVQELISAELPVGTYRQIRLYFSEAHLEVYGNTYMTDDGSLQLNSQASSGLKIFLDPPADVTEGAITNILLDFDLTKTFRPQPASDPQNATTYSLGPVVRASNLATSGEIRGTVFGEND